MSKVEWKKFYNKIAEVQHCCSCINLKSGNQIVMIEHNGAHTIITYNGDFINPRVHSPVKVADENVNDIKSIIEFMSEVF